MIHENIIQNCVEGQELFDSYNIEEDVALGFGYDQRSHVDRLEKHSEVLFIDSADIKVRLVRIPEYGRETAEDNSVLSVHTEVELDEKLAKSSNDVFRLIAFHQDFSLDPLQCSKVAMERTIQQCRVPLMFFDVLFKFGDQEQIFEESSGFRQTWLHQSGSFEICYQLMYVEPSNRAGRDPWAIRQSGMYHRFDSHDNQNLYLVLYPREKSTPQRRIEEYAESSGDRKLLAAHPMNVHIIVLSSYISFWQDHVEYLANELAELRRPIIVVSTNDQPIEAARLQKLRHLEDKIICKALRCLNSTRKLIQTLCEINSKLPSENADFAARTFQVKQQLRSYDERLEGHINAAETLAERIHATVGLLANLIDIQNQAASSQISSHMLKLTYESVDDNATVRVITVFTLIYLPASFMATLLGMNLFEFQSDNGALRISPFFWVYIAGTLPLTVLTVGAWYIFKLRHDKKKQKRNEELEHSV